MQEPLSNQRLYDRDTSWIYGELQQRISSRSLTGTRIRNLFEADWIIISREKGLEHQILIHEGRLAADYERRDPDQLGVDAQVDSLSITTANVSSDTTDTGSELPSDILQSEFYRNLIRPVRQSNHCIAARLSIQNAKYFVTLYRSPIAPPFDGRDVHRLQDLLPHLRKAFERREDFATQEDSLIQLGLPLDLRDVDYIVDSKMFVRWAASGKHTTSPLWVRLVNDRARLEATEETVQNRLTQLVESVTKAKKRQKGIMISEEAHILVMAVQTKKQEPLAAINVTSFRSALSRTCELAGTFYDLTPAEVLLCRSMLLGMSLQEHADLHHVKISTVRSHLKSLLFKTDTVRQGQLIALLFKLSSGQSVLDGSAV